MPRTRGGAFEAQGRERFSEFIGRCQVFTGLAALLYEKCAGGEKVSKKVDFSGNSPADGPSAAAEGVDLAGRAISDTAVDFVESAGGGLDGEMPLTGPATAIDPDAPERGQAVFRFIFDAEAALAGGIIDEERPADRLG